MYTLYTAAALLAASTSAAPTWPGFGGLSNLNSLGSDITNWVAHATQSSCGVAYQNPTQPQSTLAQPTSNVRYIVLGLGTQNYTCASDASTPAAIGATANLYDITKLLANNVAQQATDAFYRGIPCGADAANSAFGAPQVGTHYFTAAGVPTFDLTSFNALLSAKKTAAMNAPAGSCAGRSGSAAVPWLLLNDNGAGTTKGGLQSVYRLETAGGAAPSSCAGMPSAFTVDYAAEYWFY